MFESYYAIPIFALLTLLLVILVILNMLSKVSEDEKEISAHEYVELISFCKRKGGTKILRRFYNANNSKISRGNYKRIKRIVNNRYMARKEAEMDIINKFELKKIISTM